jgi:large subunit ribosomal protein L6
MSKSGRIPIALGNTKVEIIGQEVTFNGKYASGVYSLPEALTIKVEGDTMLIGASEEPKMAKRHVHRLWGLHRALLGNKIYGASTLFEKKVEIIGLGYKAALSGSNIVFSLGYSHKIDFVLPKTVTLEVDKTGQKLSFKSAEKDTLGHVCSMVRALRPPEPYKGTGIRVAGEEIVRKAGKAKAG